MVLEQEFKLNNPFVEQEFEKLLQDWGSLTTHDHEQKFLSLERKDAEELFLRVSPAEQAELYGYIPYNQRRSWVRMLAPDDAADFIQHSNDNDKSLIFELLDLQTKTEVSALLAYREDEAGGLMNSRFARIRPEMTVEEAIRYLRVQTRTQVEMFYYSYILGPRQELLGVASLRHLFASPPLAKVSEIMTKMEDVVTVNESTDQEEIAKLFSNNKHFALPVVDNKGRMKGIVTIDDVVQVVQEEATEDIQKLGGMEALDAPYFQIGFFEMVRKRAGWLLALFIGEMFTATAMGYFEDEISKAVVLALFIPLIISSGGNSGSQASTLVIRAMALGEIRSRDWWRVFFRELASGLALGLVLGMVGISRIFLWPTKEKLYGPHYGLVALAVGCSLVGIVLWGTLAGSMLPMLLRKLKFDPAVASAPFVATLVDVTGIIIYFTVASLFLGGILL